MILDKDSDQANKTLVILNGKLICRYLSAQEGDDGWVEVIDVRSVTNLDNSQLGQPGHTGDDDMHGFTELKTKRLEGKVEFKTL